MFNRSSARTTESPLCTSQSGKTTQNRDERKHLFIEVFFSLSLKLKAGVLLTIILVQGKYLFK